MFSFNVNNSEVEFPTSANIGHGYEAHPFPPLWPKWSHSAACDTKKLSSFLPPQNNQQEDRSSVLRYQAILRGKRELMEMIQDVPETDYELSLKDIVRQHCPGPDEQEVSIEERRSKSDGRVQSTKRGFCRKEESINQKKTVIRSKSMDYEAFALKTFFPFAMVISWRRRSKSESMSKFSPRITVDGQEYASEEVRDRSPGAGWSKNNIRDDGRISRSKSVICNSSWWKSIFHKKTRGKKKTESCSLLGSG